MPEPTHKLATIVFTDIVGFTKLSAENEPLAIQLLQTQRTTLKPIVERHSGHWLMYPFRTYGTKRVNLIRETFG